MKLTHKKLKQLLSYDPTTGIFRRMAQYNNAVHVGDIAGTDNGNGYQKISLLGVRYKSHRLAWFYIHGRWPEFEIDHKNGVRSDNRINNLREATLQQNLHNIHEPRIDNVSGYRGVSPVPDKGRWRAVIHLNQKQKHLGYFDSPAAAYLAYLAAKRKLHPFAYTGRGNCK